MNTVTVAATTHLPYKMAIGDSTGKYAGSEYNGPVMCGVITSLTSFDSFVNAHRVTL